MLPKEYHQKLILEVDLWPTHTATATSSQKSKQKTKYTVGSPFSATITRGTHIFLDICWFPRPYNTSNGFNFIKSYIVVIGLELGPTRFFCKVLLVIILGFSTHAIVATSTKLYNCTVKAATDLKYKKWNEECIQDCSQLEYPPHSNVWINKQYRVLSPFRVSYCICS